MRALQRRNDALTNEADKLDTPRDQFERSSDRDRTRRIEDELRGHLRVPGTDVAAPVDILCRGPVCRVGRLPDSGVTPELDRQWQRHNIQVAMGTRTDTYYTVRSDDTVPGIDVIETAVDTFRRSGAVDRCVARFDDPGTLEARVSVESPDSETEDDPAGLSFRIVGGALAGKPLGRCIDAALRSAFAAATLPSSYTSAHDLPVRFPLADAGF